MGTPSAPAWPPPPPASRRIALVVLALGAFAQVAQILVFREVLAVCHGSEILFGLILACGLAATALGSAVAGRIWRRGAEADAGRAAAWFAASLAFNGLLVAAAILLARSLAGWGSQAAGQALPLTRAAALTLLVTFPAAFWTGVQFILALRSLPPEDFGAAYQAESWGAVLGGVGFTFILVFLCGPLRAALVGGAVLAVVAGLVLRPPRPLAQGVLLAGVLICIAAAALPLEDRAEQLRWRGLLPGYELLEWRDTPYGRVCALQRPGTPQVSLFHSGALVTSLEAGADEADTRALADLCGALHPAPRRALVIGGTLGRFPAALLRHGLERVDAVELDPALLELAQRRGGLEAEPPGVRRLAADGRYFVKSQPAGEYDLLIVSPGVPDSALANRYCTVEFCRETCRALSGDGVLVLLLPTYGASAEYLGAALARRSASVWHAMQEVFAETRAAPVAGHLLAGAKRTGVLDFTARRLGARLAARPQAQPVVSVRVGSEVEQCAVPPEDYFEAILGGVLAMQQSLAGDDQQVYVAQLEQALAQTEAPVNRDAQPVAVAESLALGSEVSAASGSDRDRSFAAFLRAWGPWTVGLPVGGAFAVTLLLIGRRALRATLGQRRPDPGSRGGGSAKLTAGAARGPDRPSLAPLLLIAFAVGLFGMALEVALLAAYQNARGYVYGEIGGLIASFMAGLALGALAAARAGSRATRAGRGRGWLVAFVVMLAAGLALALPWASGVLAGWPSGPASAAGFWLLMLTAGFLDGAIFPPLVAWGADLGYPDCGGRTYAWDLAGAALGALVCGAAWIPCFGLSGAMYAVAGVLAAGLLALAGVRGNVAPPPSASAQG